MTPVIFRVFTDGDVLALFPDEPASCITPHLCNSYQHVGQHGAASYEAVVVCTRPASPAEYADLLGELESVGYQELHVYRRQTQRMRDQRQRHWDRLMGKVKP